MAHILANLYNFILQAVTATSVPGPPVEFGLEIGKALTLPSSIQVLTDPVCAYKGFAFSAHKPILYTYTGINCLRNSSTSRLS